MFWQDCHNDITNWCWAARWHRGNFLTSQPEGLGVESQRCLGGTRMFPQTQWTITELSKAMVCSALPRLRAMGHYT